MNMSADTSGGAQTQTQKFMRAQARQALACTTRHGQLAQQRARQKAGKKPRVPNTFSKRFVVPTYQAVVPEPARGNRAQCVAVVVKQLWLQSAMLGVR